jgi:hypothetical protein
MFLSTTTSNSVIILKEEMLRCITMFTGKQTLELVVKNLNGVGNAVNLQKNAHNDYDSLRWGIDPVEDGSGVCSYVHLNTR